MLLQNTVGVRLRGKHNGSALTRDEHLAWCKRRALEYVDTGDLTHAVASMASDLKTHPDTDNPALNGLVMIGMMPRARKPATSVTKSLRKNVPSL
jgi:hypothetical protein